MKEVCWFFALQWDGWWHGRMICDVGIWIFLLKLGLSNFCFLFFLKSNYGGIIWTFFWWILFLILFSLKCTHGTNLKSVCLFQNILRQDVQVQLYLCHQDIFLLIPFHCTIWLNRSQSTLGKTCIPYWKSRNHGCLNITSLVELIWLLII